MSTNPPSLSVTEVEQIARRILHSASSVGSYTGPIPWSAVDLPLVTAYPIAPKDRDEINLVSATGAITRWIWVKDQNEWVPIPEAFTAAILTGQMGWSAGTIPTGSLYANGAAVSRTTYADLFAVIGVVYGVGDGSSTFNIPNAVDRFLVGSGSLYALGSTGGAASVALAIGEVPSHTHSISNDGSHNHEPGSGGVFVTNLAPTGANLTTGGGGYKTESFTSTDGSHSHGGSTGTAGSGNGHQNLPPYIALNPFVWI